MIERNNNTSDDELGPCSIALLIAVAVWLLLHIHIS